MKKRIFMRNIMEDLNLLKVLFKSENLLDGIKINLKIL
jgi:hypothetical protein